MDIENTKAQMKKGILEYCILSILSKGEFYVSDILEELKKADLLVVEGTLYPLLNRLKNDNLLTYNWVESKSGPPRKYYCLTERGKTFLNELRKTWVNLVQAVNLITNNKTPNNI
ncbi:MAG: PadR family transcriptional regulator [Bacteroidia bacterium]